MKTTPKKEKKELEGFGICKGAKSFEEDKFGNREFR